MTLITCSECGKQISDKAPHCIHCGAPIGIALASPDIAVMPKIEIKGKETPALEREAPNSNYAERDIPPSSDRDKVLVFDLRQPCSGKCFRREFLLSALLAVFGAVLMAGGYKVGVIVLIASPLLQLISGARRSLDIGWTRWATLVQLVPILGLIVLFMLMSRARAQPRAMAETG